MIVELLFITQFIIQILICILVTILLCKIYKNNYIETQYLQLFQNIYGY